MGKGLFDSDFDGAFAKLLEKTGVSCYQIAQYTSLSEPYLSRLKNGEKSNPSLETIIKICLALAHLSKEVKLSDIEDLLNSVGRSLRIKS